MVKFPATRRVLFHYLVYVLLIEFKLSAGLAKHPIPMAFSFSAQAVRADPGKLYVVQVPYGANQPSASSLQTVDLS
jgi:hypothetical protein